MSITRGEYVLRSISANTMESLLAISDADIRDCASYQVYQKGKENYEEGALERLYYNKGYNTVEAEVIGSMEYQVEFYTEGDSVYGDCDCPYYGVCKHMVTSLLWILHNGIHNVLDMGIAVPSSAGSLDFLRKYLEGYSKNDLVQLVMKFAPQNFITEVHNREVRQVDANQLIHEAEQSVKSCFRKDELLMDPDAMERAIMGQLDSLRGLEDRVGMEIGALLLLIIRSVEEAFNEGYLSVDHYSHEENFESEELCEYIISFVKTLPYEERISYILKLDQALNEMSYTTFVSIENAYARFFNDSEIPGLRRLILDGSGLPDSVVSRLYDFLRPGLNAQEMELLLRRVSDISPEHFFSLCGFLKEKARYREVFDLIQEHLFERNYPHDSRIALIYLDAAKELDILTSEVVQEAVEKSPRAEVLTRIKELKGNVSTSCEKFVKDWDSAQLLSYYESENRLGDALALVQQVGGTRPQMAMGFYSKYWESFPDEAEGFLENRIQENLKEAGKPSYVKVAEALDLLRKVNSGKTALIAAEIRKNFKRRTNLMSLIRKF